MTIHMSSDKEFNLMLSFCFLSMCVFLPGWLIGFGKSQDVKQTLYLTWPYQCVRHSTIYGWHGQI